ncbi:MAG: LacI family DNA-binding transcriptional regulator [Rubrivivax sp.]|nr:LacI family DNA-binding transcriptional regulator [Rubrivivax sp.]
MRPAAPQSVTLHDVAREAGVSLITASRALSNPAVVSKATIERVQRAVEATGYVPNRLAGGLKSKRSMTVAALVPVISVPQFLPTVQTLTETLDAAGYQLILGQTGYDRARERALLETMVGRRVDAIVVAGLLEPQGWAERLRRLHIPVVETWDLTDRPVDLLVGFSHLKAGSAVAGYFLARGWRHVGVATADDQRAMQRHAGFASAVGRSVPTAIVKAPSTVRAGRTALAELLRQDPALEAVHCSSDALAAGVLIEARTRCIAVPQQLAVCGFGDADFAECQEPSLTTVRIAGADIGRRAAEMVIARGQGREVAERIVDVGFSIVERGSTASR